MQKSVANNGILSVTSDGTIIFAKMSAVEEKLTFSRIAITHIINMIITATTIAAVRYVKEAGLAVVLITLVA